MLFQIEVLGCLPSGKWDACTLDLTGWKFPRGPIKTLCSAPPRTSWLGTKPEQIIWWYKPKRCFPVCSGCFLIRFERGMNLKLILRLQNNFNFLVLVISTKGRITWGPLPRCTSTPGKTPLCSCPWCTRRSGWRALRGASSGRWCIWDTRPCVAFTYLINFLWWSHRMPILLPSYMHRKDLREFSYARQLGQTKH